MFVSIFKHIKFANRFCKTSKLERKFLKPAFIQKHMNFKMLERTMWDEYQNDFLKISLITNLMNVLLDLRIFQI